MITESHPVAPENRKRRRGLTVLLVAAIVLLVAGITVGLMLWKQHRDRNRHHYEYFVAAPELSVMEQMKDGSYRFVEKVTYGTTFALECEGTTSGGKIYFRIIPFDADSEYVLPERFAGKNLFVETIGMSDLQDADYLGYYNATFPVREAQNLPSTVKKVIFDYDYSHDSDLTFAQNADRVKSMIAYADFDRDGQEDVAVILESTDVSETWSRLFIICYNPDLGKSYIAYEDGYHYGNGKPLLRNFRQGTPIYMESEAPVAAPNNGVLREFPLSGDAVAILYDPVAKEFRNFVQMPLSQLEGDDDQGYDGDQEEEPEAEPEAGAEEVG